MFKRLNLIFVKCETAVDKSQGNQESMGIEKTGAG